MLRELCACAVIVLMTVGCGEKEQGHRCLLPEGTELREGDVVFRRGGGLVSHVVVAADRGGNYSHIGIVVDSAGVKMIVHAVPDEPDYEGDIDRVKMDRPETFFSSKYTSVGEVCRFKGDTAIAHKAALAAMAVYKRYTPFDHDYDDRDTTKMYCTELVVHSYKLAGVDIAGKERHHVNLPFLQAYCIFPSDVHESKKFETVTIF